ncbi:hypothetical protein R1flu_008314 [Riccia fluitans]|uniref:Uncharacterized protein n=1 Tax=Riccia fluitans TaxID=41844 RepID=A0ABD1YCD1_9MARC
MGPASGRTGERSQLGSSNVQRKETSTSQANTGTGRGRDQAKLFFLLCWFSGDFLVLRIPRLILWHARFMLKFVSGFAGVGGGDRGASSEWGRESARTNIQATDSGDGSFSEGSGNNDNRNEALAILATIGRSLESLPKDLAAAVDGGEIPADIIQRFLEKSPFRNWLMQFAGSKNVCSRTIYF